MAKAVRFYEAGGPEVLRYEDVAVGDPGPGEVRVRHAAVGLNFADTYFRLGYYPVPLPNGMGVEASGVIEAVGAGRHRLRRRRPRDLYRQPARRLFDRAGDAGRLACSSCPTGSATKSAAAIDHARPHRRLLAAARPIPWLKAGDTILLHAAAGGVGLIAVQWAKLLGLRVIGTVSTEAKAADRHARMAATRSSSTAARMSPSGSGS